jgi:hypothetical protein
MKSDLDTLIEELEAGVWSSLSNTSATGEPQTSVLNRALLEPCWHCGGSGECGCSTCAVMKPAVIWAAGECVACKYRRVPVQ